MHNETIFRRQWRPVASESWRQESTWTTFDHADVVKAKTDYPWMRFQSRLISEWANEQGEPDGTPPQAEPQVEPAAGGVE